MKPTKISLFLILSLLGSGLGLPLMAQGPGRGGRGPGQGGGGPGGFQDAIHTLFDNHGKIKRSVEVTATGYKSRTVSDDPEVAKTLQKHVREMRERLGAGKMIRRWDPAFAELVAHYDSIDHEFKEVEGGVEMVASGKTPEAVKVAQNHARIVSGFVEKGPAQMHQKHAPALTGDAQEGESASDTSPAGTDHEPRVSGGPREEAKTKECCEKAAKKSPPTDGQESPKQAKEDTPSRPACCHARTCAKQDPGKPAH